MFNNEDIKSLHRWTHGCLDIVFEHAASMLFALLVQEIPGAAHGSIRNQMTHVLATEAGWIGDLQNASIEERRPEEFSSLDSLLVEKRKVMTETMAYLDGLTETALNMQISFRPTSWVGPLRSPAYILHHVVTHAFHHKGQIAMMYRMLGHPIGDTDLQRTEVA